MYGVSESSSSWTTNSDGPDFLPGIDAASLSFVTLNAGPADGVDFIIWSDLPNRTSGRGSGKRGGSSYKGLHGAADGREVVFTAATPDGNSGSVTVDGVRYDIAKGGLILISATGDKPEVMQIEVDTSQFPRDKDGIMKFAKSNADVLAFWKKHNKAVEAPEVAEQE